MYIKENIMRTFIAIEFDKETKNNISNLQNAIKADCKKGNFTTKDNLHLTLHFLGEIEEDDFTRIFNINVFAVYRVNKIFFPMIKNKGRII